MKGRETTGELLGIIIKLNCEFFMSTIHYLKVKIQRKYLLFESLDHLKKLMSNILYHSCTTIIQSYFP